jgi:hypothetical protein
MIRSVGDVDDIALFIPYIFVDNPWSMTCGNTVIGYPKQLAWFQIGGPLENPYPIKIDTSVFVKYSPNTPQTWQLLTQIQNPGLLAPLDVPKSATQAWPFGDLDRIFGPGGDFPLDGKILDLFKAEPGTYGAVQLKQFRNAVNITEASYQALVSCKVYVAPGGSFGPLPNASIEIPAYDSLNIASELGLISADGSTFQPIIPFWMSCDFNCQDFQEIPLP